MSKAGVIPPGKYEVNRKGVIVSGDYKGRFLPAVSRMPTEFIRNRAVAVVKASDSTLGRQYERAA